MNINWNPESYEDKFSFVHKYGEGLLSLIDNPCKGAFALDLGCGSGALTEKLADMGFDVLGIDDSPEMVHAAQKLHPNLKFRLGNAENFRLESKADLVFSNAVFHWIDAESQVKTARNIFAALKGGGALVCEFGGKGCAEAIHGTLENIFEQRGLKYPRTFYFPTIGEYASVLESAGFEVEYAALFDRPTPQNGERGIQSWIEAFIKKPFEGMSAADKAEIINEAADILRGRLCKYGEWFVDYVRIRVKAVKPPRGTRSRIYNIR